MRLRTRLGKRRSTVVGRRAILPLQVGQDAPPSLRTAADVLGLLEQLAAAERTEF
jgi:hypothetical protein